MDKQLVKALHEPEPAPGTGPPDRPRGGQRAIQEGSASCSRDLSEA